MKSFARIFSWVFLPLLTPLYALLIVMYTESWEADYLQPNSLYVLNNPQKFGVLYIYGLFSFIVPSLIIVFLRIQGRVGSVMLDNRKERLIPAFTTILSGIGLIYTIYTYIPEGIYGYKFIMGLAIGSLATVIACTLITFRTKISLHAAGMGILSGFLVGYYAHMYEFSLLFIIISFILSGIVMSMRMILGAHNLAQSLLGYVLGLAISFSAVVLTMRFL